MIENKVEGRAFYEVVMHMTISAVSKDFMKILATIDHKENPLVVSLTYSQCLHWNNEKSNILLPTAQEGSFLLLRICFQTECILCIYIDANYQGATVLDIFINTEG